jgi:hypothetical protein
VSRIALFFIVKTWAEQIISLAIRGLNHQVWASIDLEFRLRRRTTMSDIKRSPGRPKGSGKNDSECLAEVADLLVRNPKLRPTTAMKQIIKMRSDRGATPETLLRRLQAKWKKDSTRFLDAARERASRVSFPPRSASMGDGLPSLAAIAQAQKWVDSKRWRAG